jgi:uncharacterized protein YhhL (DUF1145 family)
MLTVVMQAHFWKNGRLKMVVFWNVALCRLVQVTGVPEALALSIKMINVT